MNSADILAYMQTQTRLNKLYSENQFCYFSLSEYYDFKTCFSKLKKYEQMLL